MGPVAPTSKAIVHWIGCINAIKMFFFLIRNNNEEKTTQKMVHAKRGVERGKVHGLPVSGGGF